MTLKQFQIHNHSEKKNKVFFSTLFYKFNKASSYKMNVHLNNFKKSIFSFSIMKRSKVVLSPLTQICMQRFHL